MRYPNAPDREHLLEGIDDNAKALRQTVQRFVDGQAPRVCKECKKPLYVTMTGPLFCETCGIGWDPFDNEWNWKMLDENNWYQPLKRIWCDFNAEDDEGIRLTTRGSLKSLEENPTYIGERVLLTDGDVHVEGFIREGLSGYATPGYLVGEPDWNTKGYHCTECGEPFATPDADKVDYYCDACGYKLAGCSDE